MFVWHGCSLRAGGVRGRCHVILHGKNMDHLRAFPDNHFDAIVTDPPYGIRFMNQRWDYDVPGLDVWQECLRILKPGGYLLAFGGTRTYHRLLIRIEDAGFIPHPMLAWIFGTGFPKARKVDLDGYDGWRYGLQSLKPAMEPIAMAQKPMSERTGTVLVRCPDVRIAHRQYRQSTEYQQATLTKAGDRWRVTNSAGNVLADVTLGVLAALGRRGWIRRASESTNDE